MQKDCLQVCAWHDHFCKSADRMRELAGGPENSFGLELDPETVSLASSLSQEDLQKVAGQTQSPMEVEVSLGEVALFVSGRPCKIWWPSEVRLDLTQQATRNV